MSCSATRIDSPRGRIDLIRAMLEKGGAPAAKTVHHLDRCLSCLSCVTTCAVKVDYAHLIDIGRSYIEDNYRRPVGERALRRTIAELLPYPRRFAQALRLAKLARPVAGLLPRHLRNLVELASGQRTAAEFLRPGVFPADGHRRMRVALLAGLRAADARSQHQCRNDPAVAAPRLRRHRFAGRGMLRSAAAAHGTQRAWQAPRPRQHRGVEPELATGLDAIVINASGCGTTVKDYGHLVGERRCRTAHLRARARRDRTALGHRHARPAGPSRIASPITTPARCSTASV